MSAAQPDLTDRTQPADQAYPADQPHQADQPHNEPPAFGEDTGETAVIAAYRPGRPSAQPGVELPSFLADGPELGMFEPDPPASDHPRTHRYIGGHSLYRPGRQRRARAAADSQPAPAPATAPAEPARRDSSDGASQHRSAPDQSRRLADPRSPLRSWGTPAEPRYDEADPSGDGDRGDNVS